MSYAVSMKDVLRIIRIDGAPASPFVFLTIEDGGDPYTNPEDIIEDAHKGLLSGEFEHGVSDKVSVLGRPGKVISKIMNCMISGDNGLGNWRDYAINKLYNGKECNLKFYPLGRNNQNTWGNYEKWTSLKSWEYMEVCQLERTQTLFAHQALKAMMENVSQKHFIIAAARWEWMPFMNLIFPPDTMDFERSIRQRKYANTEKDKREKYTFYYRNDGSLAYAYFNIFRRPLPDDYIAEFAQAYVHEVKGGSKETI